MKYVIVGAGPAGVVAAAMLRKLDPKTEIKLIGGEPEPPYSRMAIPYYLIGNVKEEGTHLKTDANYYKEKRIDYQQGWVTKLDPKKKEVHLKDGKKVGYDKLLLATGAYPIRPPVPGIDDPDITGCWTLEDARLIAKKCKKGTKVVQMGAGFIGCIIMEAIALTGVDLTIVEMGDRMVPRMMNETCGNLIKRWCEEKGIRVHTSTKIVKIEKRQDQKPAYLLHTADGKKLEADLIIASTGVAPALAYIKGSGIEMNSGILINPFMETSVPDVYAAGDCAEGRDFSTGGYEVQAIQPTATEHGRIAAQNMAGLKTPHPGSLNMNVLDTVGLISSSFGLWMGVEGGDHAELLDADNFRYLRLEFEGDVLVGAQALGLTQHIGVLRGLIQTKTHLGPWKEKLMADPTQIMPAYLATAQAQAQAKA
ncbi:MAG: FAD-dependent oxidoreductase [Pseudomonadota bacterium]